MRRFTRREFMGRGAKAALTIGASQLVTACPVSDPPFAPIDQRARVAAVRGLDLDAMARDALAAFGGAGAIINPGERVFIKANFGAFGMVKYNPVQAGDATKPEIVIAVAEECLKAGASEVIVGEAGQSNSWNWEDVVTLDGTTNMAAAAQRLNEAYAGHVTLACLHVDSPTWEPIPSPHTHLGRICVSSLLTQADRVISIAVIKSHRWTQVTGALKNFVGVTSGMIYGLGMNWRFLLHDAGIEQCFLDIVNAVKPDFSIVDCSIGCEGNGPHVLPGWWGTTVDMRERLGDWLLLAGPDLAAVDATAARVISHDVAGIDHLCMTYDQGLGQTREDMIDLDGAQLSALQVDWLPAEQTEGFREVLLPGLMLIT